MIIYISDCVLEISPFSYFYFYEVPSPHVRDIFFVFEMHEEK